MSITATVTSSPITATASASSVTAAVSSSSVTASASGGVGPQGPTGSGATQMSELSDVLFTSLAANDVLRYSTSKWRNYPDKEITDGGNF